MVQLVNQPIKEIKKMINRNDRVLWFHIKKKNATLVAKGKTKKEAKTQLIKKINAKPNKYIDSRLWRMHISTHDRANKKSHKKPIFGDVQIILRHYTVKEYKDHLKIKSAYEPGKGGSIWFTKEWLEYNKWNKKYIMKILKKTIASKKKILKLTAPNWYDGLFD